MDSISIDNLDDRLAAGLRQQAERNGRSIEDEVFRILQREVAPEEPAAQTSVAAQWLSRAMREFFADVGGVKLELAERHLERELSITWIVDNPQAKDRLDELIRAFKRGQGKSNPTRILGDDPLKDFDAEKHKQAVDSLFQLRSQYEPCNLTIEEILSAIKEGRRF